MVSEFEGDHGHGPTKRFRRPDSNEFKIVTGRKTTPPVIECMVSNVGIERGTVNGSDSRLTRVKKSQNTAFVMKTNGTLFEAPCLVPCSVQRHSLLLVLQVSTLIFQPNGQDSQTHKDRNVRLGSDQKSSS